jgi:hypothetical protein
MSDKLWIRRMTGGGWWLCDCSVGEEGRRVLHESGEVMREKYGWEVACRETFTSSLWP